MSSLWSRFWDRFLPRAERRDALWLAIPVGILARVAGEYLAFYPSQIAQFFPESSALQRIATLMTSGWLYVGTAVVVSALPWLIMLPLLLRFTPAPRALALYAFLLTALDGAAGTVSVVGYWIASSVTGDPAYVRAEWVLPSLSFAIVPPLAICLAARLTPLSARVVAAEGSASARGPRPRPWLGWDGAPPVGAARLAIFFVVIEIVPTVWRQSWSFVSTVAPRTTPGTGILELSALSVYLVATALAFGIGAYLIVKRFHGPRSVWLPNAISIPSSLLLLTALPFALAQMNQARDYMSRTELILENVSIGLTEIFVFLTAVAPLIGVWLATRGGASSRSASGTLPAEGDGAD